MLSAFLFPSLRATLMNVWEFALVLREGDLHAGNTKNLVRDLFIHWAVEGWPTPMSTCSR